MRSAALRRDRLGVRRKGLAAGHEALVFLFQDDHVHLNEKGGVQFADLKDAESAVAHVPNCKFAIILIDHEDVWHAEFHDCHSTDMTFTKDTGHAKKAH